ncbi:metalloprotease family M67A, partial [Achlya hypogyna]
ESRPKERAREAPPSFFAPKTPAPTEYKVVALDKLLSSAPPVKPLRRELPRHGPIVVLDEPPVRDTTAKKRPSPTALKAEPEEPRHRLSPVTPLRKVERHDDKPTRKVLPEPVRREFSLKPYVAETKLVAKSSRRAKAAECDPPSEKKPATEPKQEATNDAKAPAGGAKPPRFDAEAVAPKVEEAVVPDVEESVVPDVEAVTPLVEEADAETIVTDANAMAPKDKEAVATEVDQLATQVKEATLQEGVGASLKAAFEVAEATDIGHLPEPTQLVETPTPAPAALPVAKSRPPAKNSRAKAKPKAKTKARKSRKKFGSDESSSEGSDYAERSKAARRKVAAVAEEPPNEPEPPAYAACDHHYVRPPFVAWSHRASQEEQEEDDNDDGDSSEATPLSLHWTDLSVDYACRREMVWHDDVFTDTEEDNPDRLAALYAEEAPTRGRRNVRSVQHSQLRQSFLTGGALDPHMMVECAQYALAHNVNDKRPQQPFHVRVHPDVAFVCDLHAHLAMREIIGYFGGKFDAASNTVYIHAAFPCRSMDIAGDDGATDVEMDPASQLEVRQLIEEAQLDVVGWYHSHPTFAPDPSIRDIENQASHQELFTSATATHPFVGLIVGTYDAKRTDPVGLFRYFHVRGEKITGRPKAPPMYFPFELATKTRRYKPRPVAPLPDAADADPLLRLRGAYGAGISGCVEQVVRLLEYYRSFPGRTRWAHPWQKITKADKLRASLRHHVRAIDVPRAQQAAFVEEIVRYVQTAWK